jgi:hypothetical protein
MGATTKQVAKADEAFLREAAERIRQRMSQDIIEVGRELIAVKGRVGHGKFLRWIDVEVEISEPTATRMMNVAREYGHKAFTVKHMKPTVLYELAAPSTPPEVRAKIECRVAAGEKVTIADVHALKQEMEKRAFVVEHGTPALVEAIHSGEISVSAAKAFVHAHPPTEQDRLIIEAGRSVATAVEKANAEANAKLEAKANAAAVKTLADRAAQAMPRRVPDPKPAADRAEARSSLDAARATYVATVDAAHLNVPQRTDEIRKVVRQLYVDGLPDFRLLLGSSDGGKLN